MAFIGHCAEVLRKANILLLTFSDTESADGFIEKV